MEKLFRRVHFVSIILVGIQLLLWVATGFAFTLFDFQDVRGNYEKAAPREDVGTDFDLARARAALGSRTVLEARLRRVAGRPMVELRTPEGVVLVEGDQVVSPLSREDAIEIARQAVNHAPPLRSVTRQEAKVAEYGLELPAWRVEFDDPKDTTLYVSPTTGEVLAHRNMKWREFDLFWSLHVLGYIDRSSPAQWPLRIVAGLALVAALSGTGIALTSLRRKHA